MLGFFRKPSIEERQHADALKQIVREILGLADAVTVSVSEIQCGDASCPGTETVILVLSEMSRTPRLNGQNGKDHWPVTSAMVIGGGVRGGRAYGGTTNGLEARPIDLATGDAVATGGTLQTNQLAAGVLELCGADPAPWFPGVEALRGFHA